MSSKVKKLELLEKAPELVIFDEITALRGQIKAIYGQLKSDSSKEVVEYKTELGTLIEKLDNLQKSIQEKDTVVNIPLDQLSEQIKKVEQAIKGIKEVKIPEVKFPTEYPLSELQINELLLAIQSIPEFPIKELEKMVLGLGSKIEAIKLEAPENNFDYEFLDEKFEKLIKAVKNISISVGGGGGGLSDVDRATLNSLATEETLQSIAGSSWVSSNIDTADATYYYFLSFIPGTTKWRINRLNKTSYVSDYATGDSAIATAWTNRATQTYSIIY